MANCYKNFPVKVNYSNSTHDIIYGNSTSLSEDLQLEHAESLGAKGSNSVFTKTVPKGGAERRFLLDERSWDL